MLERAAFPDGDAAANLLQLRWFAADKAARDARAQCDVLLQVIAQAESAWRLARSRLEAFEKLRDAFDADLNGVSDRTLAEPPRQVHAVMSAA
jgi:hypothetical protein